MKGKKDQNFEQCIRNSNSYSDFIQQYEKCRDEIIKKRGDGFFALYDRPKEKNGMSSKRRKKTWGALLDALRTFIAACETKETERILTGMLDVLEKNMAYFTQKTDCSREEVYFILDILVDILQVFMQRWEEKVLYPAMLDNILGDLTGEAKAFYGEDARERVAERCGRNLAEMKEIVISEKTLEPFRTAETAVFFDRLGEAKKAVEKQGPADMILGRVWRGLRAYRKPATAVLLILVLIATGIFCYMAGQKSGYDAARRQYEEMMEENGAGYVMEGAQR